MITTGLFSVGAATVLLSASLTIGVSSQTRTPSRGDPPAARRHRRGTDEWADKPFANTRIDWLTRSEFQAVRCRLQTVSTTTVELRGISGNQEDTRTTASY